MSTEPYLSGTVGATPEEVWRALRDPDEIRRWFGWDYAAIDEEIALIFHGAVPEEMELPEGLDTAVEVDEAARTLRTGAHEIRVDGHGAEAVVRVTRVIDVGDDGWEMFHAEIDHIEEGWLTFFQQLAFALARHPGEVRRTAFGMGTLLESLGVDAVTAAVGEPYAVTLATGEELTGTVWFRSEHQVGLTVDGWGDGLLVVSVLPGEVVLAIASTYGLGAELVTALEARWTAWFAGHATPKPDGA